MQKPFGNIVSSSAGAIKANRAGKTVPSVTGCGRTASSLQSFPALLERANTNVADEGEVSRRRRSGRERADQGIPLLRAASVRPPRR
jgi:hypothetical protein